MKAARMAEWKCQSCQTVQHERPVSAFAVPAGWMKLVHANTFHVFCSWACLIAFASIWSALADAPEEAARDD